MDTELFENGAFSKLISVDATLVVPAAQNRNLMAHVKLEIDDFSSYLTKVSENLEKSGKIVE